MYKKIIFCFLLISLICGCTYTTNNENNQIDKKYVRSVWLTYYEISEFTQDNDENEFKSEITKRFKELKKNGFNRVTVQVRPFADAFYKSNYFPVSAYCFGKQGSELKYDPLEIMCSCAEKSGLEIEAWINPYRVSNKNDFSELSTNSISYKWKNTENLIVCDEGIYFNPASEKVIELIVNGVKEIVENYSVSSVCFDDYFYPTTNEDIDKTNYEKYKGNLSLEDFRRENVNNLIRKVYKTVKLVNENVTFGISPASNISNDYECLYADVEKWVTNEGYVDYICPQIYFGFQNENQPFMKTTKLWSKMAECDMYVALPLYKQGKPDEFAGELGINEFVNNNNIISRQITYLSKLDEIDGFYIFSYSSLNDNEESQNLYSAMQTSSK